MGVELMWGSKKENWDKPFSEKVAKRISKIPSADLTLWFEQAMSETNRTLSIYIKQPDKIYLNDLLLGAEAIHAIAYEIKKRNML
jgi:hypothetical protein